MLFIVYQWMEAEDMGTLTASHGKAIRQPLERMSVDVLLCGPTTKDQVEVEIKPPRTVKVTIFLDPTWWKSDCVAHMIDGMEGISVSRAASRVAGHQGAVCELLCATGTMAYNMEINFVRVTLKISQIVMISGVAPPFPIRSQLVFTNQACLRYKVNVNTFTCCTSSLCQSKTELAL